MYYICVYILCIWYIRPIIPRNMTRAISMQMYSIFTQDDADFGRISIIYTNKSFRNFVKPNQIWILNYIFPAIPSYRYAGPLPFLEMTIFA